MPSDHIELGIDQDGMRPKSQVRTRLFAGGRWIRTLGPPWGRRMWVPGPTAPGRRVLDHAGGTADREIALLTGGNGMSRVLRPI